jgi:hypothetical protein
MVRASQASAKVTGVLEDVERVLGDEWLPSGRPPFRFPSLNGIYPTALYIKERGSALLTWVVEGSIEGAEGSPVARWPWANHTVGPVENMLVSLDSFRRELAEQCLALDPERGLASIATLVVFVDATEADVRDRIAPHIPHASRAYVKAIAGERLADASASDLCEWADRTSRLFTEDAYRELVALADTPRIHMGERLSDRALTSKQRIVVMNRGDVQSRRIRGPAGSGKTMVLAGRAARLARDGKRVLLVYFTNSLGAYEWYSCLRHANDADMLVGGAAAGDRWCPAPFMHNITILPYYMWVRRLFSRAGAADHYRHIWYQSTGAAFNDSATAAAQSLHELLRDSDSIELPMWDAVLVDEGQDMRVEWWNTLRRYVAADGEMILAADKSQDVFDQHAWVDANMPKAGFHGKWMDFDFSHRLPTIVADMVACYCNAFLQDDRTRVGSNPQMTGDCRLRWIQVPADRLAPVLARETAKMASPAARYAGDLSGIGAAPLMLSMSVEVGAGAVDALPRFGDLDCIHTFQSSARSSKVAKLGFSRQPADIRSTTVHSVKGWEAPYVCLAVHEVHGAKGLRTVYTGMTRVLQREAGSALTVVCSDPRLGKWARAHPEFWEFVDER